MLRLDNSGLLWAGHTHVIWILTLQRDSSAVNQQQPAISTSSVLWFSFHCWFLLDYLQFPQQTVFEDNQRFLTTYPGATEICMFYHQLIFCRFDSGTKHFLINAQLSQLMSCEALSNWRHAFKGKQLNWNYWNVDKTCSSHCDQPREMVKLLSSLLSSVTGKSKKWNVDEYKGNLLFIHHFLTKKVCSIDLFFPSNISLPVDVEPLIVVAVWSVQCVQ